LTTNWTHIAKRIALIMIVPLLIGAYIFVNYTNKNNVCKDIVVHIQNSNVVQFVTPTELKEIVKNTSNITLGATQLKDINCKQIEATIVNNPWVKSANIFVDHHDVINIDILQKEPVVRWLNGDLIQSYLDADCNAIPVNTNYSANVPLVTSTKTGSTLPEQKLKAQVVTLCKYIQHDTFWNAAITQININAKQQFELVTNIGDHTILFGDTTKMQNKFARLFTFYKEALPRQGYNTFHTLDVKNDGQIVAIKADSMYVALQKIRLAKLTAEPDSTHKPITNNNAIVQKVQVPKILAVASKPKPSKPVKPKIITKLNNVTKESSRVIKAQKNLQALLAKPAKPKKEQTTKPKQSKPKSTNKNSK
jgi:cell division protein FtsQ